MHKTLITLALAVAAWTSSGVVAMTLQESKMLVLKEKLMVELADMTALEMAAHFQDEARVSRMLTHPSFSNAILSGETRVNDDSGFLPVVQCHGMGDFASNSMGMVPLRNDISKRLNGTYTVNVPLADTDIGDMLASFTMKLDDEVEAFRKFVQNDPRLQNGFNALGWSQGNLWIRGYVEKYNDPPVKNWISINGPMVGITGLPHCNFGSIICKLLDGLAGDAVYSDLIQQHLAQANYFRDPLKIETYKKHCLYMPDLNNEKESTHSEYKRNLMKTDNIIAVKALDDTMVVPKESEHFGYYADGSTTHMLPMNETKWYTEDTFGLKTFHEAGRLHLVDAPGDHMQIPLKQLMALIDQYFT